MNTEERRKYMQKYREGLKMTYDYPESRREASRHFRNNYPEIKKGQNVISHNSEKYPLEDKCEFCDSTKHLEHGHVDYDYPEIYLTVCHQCNLWMGKGGM